MTRVTLKDVAKESGVSFSLVSKVLRSKELEKISNEKIVLINETALRMGYVVNKHAQSLKTGKSMLIAVVMPMGSNVSSTIFPVLSEAILNVSSRNECEYGFIFFYTLGGIKEYENLQEIISINPDGIIYSVPPKAIYGFSHDIERQRMLKNVVESGKPILFCMEKYNIPDTCSLLFDEIAGGYEGTRYLIDKGCRHIMFCRGSFDERMGGYIKAMTEHNLNYTGLITDYVGFSYDDGYDFFKKLHGNSPYNNLPDAIFATCDICALGILQAMSEVGLTRENIEVMGYDGLSVARISGKKFPTVVQPLKEIGMDAANTIINWIETGVKPENRIYSPEIKVL